ncbi:MAG: tetratricopeptide repeat protein [Ginsengibacter sp.]|jgi:tetratricopeptide (TPR) repeat protein
MKKIGLLSTLLLAINILFAQSIEEGKKFLNYERFESASSVFNKLLAANPNDVDAAYWLGQTYLQNSDFPDSITAKKLYQKTLDANPNNPLMMVGIGEIELMEGKLNDARNRFETALNLTKKKDRPGILLEIGRANVDTKNGDALYAISKLNEAADKDKKNAEIQLILGDAYRKLIDGANATTSYQNAINLDSKNARAYFMIGRIYETQGYGQEPIYMKYYNDAITADPNFAPVYYWLYGYYYQRDVNKAREFLNKYIAVADQDSKNCYAEASLLLVSKLFQQAITKADNCITTVGNQKPFPNLYGVKAYAYYALGDSSNAKLYFEEFFQKVNPEKIGPNDYATYAKVLLMFPGQEDLATTYVEKAIELDTVPSKKLEYVTDIAKSLYDSARYAEAGQWYGKILKMNPKFGKVDLFWAGYSDYRGGNYKSADSVFTIYQRDFPEDLYGWYLGARSKEGLDSAGLKGLAKPNYDRIIQLADTIVDKQSIKDKLIPAYRYMVAYYYNVLKDVPNAVKYNDLILVVDPNDATALKTKEAFISVMKQMNARNNKSSSK